jgi:2-polyprenyl-3-methyl-5-hydroxy-6-metoxy-1,4-benzoquinol methylase
MIHYQHCPACGSEAIAAQLSAVDYTVSQQRFQIWHCKGCGLRFTQDVPDEAAIGPYYQSETYVSHSDTKKGLINTLYHLVRKRTLNGKKKLVIEQSGLLKGAILDIGAGTGAFLHTMQAAGWGVTGLEPDATARQKAAELYGIAAALPGELFALKKGSYNVVTLWHVLEHVHNLQGYLQQIHQLLAPGGCLLIAVPNYTSHDAQTYGPYWAAWDVPRHLYHFSPQAMQALLVANGFAIKRMKHMWFDSFYVSMLSERYKKGRGNLISAFFTGLLSNIKAMGKADRCSSVIYVAIKKA